MSDGYTFIVIPSDVLEDSRVDWPAKIVWATVWGFSRANLDCWVSLDELANRCHRSRRQVTAYISQLRKLGWLEVHDVNGRRRHLTAHRPATLATSRDPSDGPPPWKQASTVEIGVHPSDGPPPWKQASTVEIGVHPSDGPPPWKQASTIEAGVHPDTRPAATLSSDGPPPIRIIEKTKRKERNGEPPTPKKNGTPPDLADVREYWDEIAPGDGNGAAEFFDYWTSAGWRRRSGPIRDWRAAARNWVRSPYRRGNREERRLDPGRGLEWANK